MAWRRGVGSLAGFDLTIKSFVVPTATYSGRHKLITTHPPPLSFHLFHTQTMQMDGWADHLHTSLYGEHALFPGLRLTSFPAFIVAAALSASICLLERYVSAPSPLSQGTTTKKCERTHIALSPSLSPDIGYPSTPPASHACAVRSGGRRCTP